MRAAALTIVLFLLTVSVSAQDAASYIHYYDSIHGGLVIERADGTDSRFMSGIPQGVPVWSPSGRWMIVRDTVWSTDGTTRLPLMEEKPFWSNDYRLQWAHGDDTLLVAFLLYVDGQMVRANTYTLLAQLYDAETRTVLNTFEYPGLQVNGGGLGEAYWEADGTAATVFYARSLFTLKRDGTSVIFWGDPSYTSMYPPPKFTNGHHLYAVQGEGDRLPRITQDSSGSKRLELKKPIGQRNQPYSLWWNPVLTDFALLTQISCNDEICESLVDLINWATGEIKPIMVESARLLWHTGKLWSPSGRYALLTDGLDSRQLEEPTKLYTLDVFTGLVRQIPIRDTVAEYHWAPDGRLYIAYEGENSFVGYNPYSGNEVTLTLPATPHRYSEVSGTMFHSPDGQYIGLATDPVTVTDFNGEVVSQVLKPSHSTFSECCPRAYGWSEDGRWAIASYAVYFRDLSHVTSAQIVFDLRGALRRELPSAGQSGFVPRRALPYLAPSNASTITRRPAFTLLQNGRVDGVGWHPNDPDRLVAYSKEDGLVFWSLAGSRPAMTGRVSVSGALSEADPGGLTLYWLPDQNAVAFYDDELDRVRRIDIETGEIALLEDVDYPMFEVAEDGSTILRSGSSEQLPVEWRLDTEHGSVTYLTSDWTGFVISKLDDYRSKTPFLVPYKNNFSAMEAQNDYIDAASGAVTPLEFTNNVYTSDARGGIAALGNSYICCTTIVDTDDGRIIDQFFTTAVSLAFSADGRRLATTAYGQIMIWDMSSYHDG